MSYDRTKQRKFILQERVGDLPFRFRKSFKIAPGVKVNFNKKSTGITFGGKGMHYTVNSKGKRTKSIGVPGTGLYYTSSSSTAKNKSNKKERYVKDNIITNNEGVKMEKKKWYQRSWVIALLLVYFFPAGIYLMWKYTNWSKGIKIGASAFWGLIVCVMALGGSPETEVPVSDVAITTSITQTEEISSEPFTTEQSKVTTTEATTAVSTTVTTEAATSEEFTSEENTAEYITEEDTEAYVTEEDYTEAETTEEEYYEEEYTEEEEYYYESDEEYSESVWITATGTKYHSIPDCGNTKTSYEISLDDAESRGYDACSKCW